MEWHKNLNILNSFSLPTKIGDIWNHLTNINQASDISGGIIKHEQIKTTKEKKKVKRCFSNLTAKLRQNENNT